MENKDAVQRLAALAQDSRLDIFRLLVRRAPTPMAAGEIAEHFGLPNATLSFHLKELTQAGLLVSKQDGRRILFTPQFSAMQQLMGFLMENCCEESDGELNAEGCCD